MYQYRYGCLLNRMRAYFNSFEVLGASGLLNMTLSTRVRICIQEIIVNAKQLKKNTYTPNDLRNTLLRWNKKKKKKGNNKK